MPVRFSIHIPVEGGEARLTVAVTNSQKQSRSGFRNEICSNEVGTGSNRWPKGWR